MTSPSKKRTRPSSIIDNSVGDNNKIGTTDHRTSTTMSTATIVRHDGDTNSTSSTNNNGPPSSSSVCCWKCKGYGRRYSKTTQLYDSDDPCKVCNGMGYRNATDKSRTLANQPGRIVQLRGYPKDHPFKLLYPEGFSGPRAVWGSGSGHDLTDDRGDGGTGEDTSIENSNNKTTTSGNGNVSTSWLDLPRKLWPRHGEVVGSLSGDWRVYQVANGNKLTVDDFICAWVASHEMWKRGWVGEDNRRDRRPLFGGISVQDAELGMATTPPVTNRTSYFTHADLGTGCGSVLMMVAWAFLGQIRSVGVEAQDVSFDCLQRGLLWNLGRDGSGSNDIVRAKKTDLRLWNGIVTEEDDVDIIRDDDDDDDNNNDDGHEDKKTTTNICQYQLITGTPPYFPLDSFVASENHEQKVRCRVPTRGGAVQYIEAASRLLMESKNDSDDDECHGDDTNGKDGGGGVFCMVEAAFEKAEMAVLKAVDANNMKVQRRLDVITREGLPPRFSCWVMTKKEKKIDTDHSRTTNAGTSTTTTKLTMESTPDEPTALFPIETLTLRNKDLSRTKEYSTAMEEMGWVDFEKSNCKSEKTFVDCT